MSKITHLRAFRVLDEGHAKPASLFRAEFESESGPVVVTMPSTVARQLLAKMVLHVPSDDYAR
jgi:hypothetical protein